MYNIIGMFPYVKFDVVVFLCAFLKDHNFGLFSVFLEMISNITELLKEYSVFREFCKSTLDRGEIIVISV